MRSKRGLILLPALVAGVLACEAPAPGPVVPETPDDVALALFDLAQSPDPAPDRVAMLFAPIDDERDQARLLDAVAMLSEAEDVVILSKFAMEEDARTGFELEGRLTGGGAARYSLQIDVTDPPGTIVWFTGPGVEWPVRNRRGQGLSTSAPPEPPPGG